MEIYQIKMGLNNCKWASLNIHGLNSLVFLTLLAVLYRNLYQLLTLNCYLRGFYDSVFERIRLGI